MRGCELLSVLVVCRLRVVNQVGLGDLGYFLLQGLWVQSSLTVLIPASRAGGDAGLIHTALQPRAVSCLERAFDGAACSAAVCAEPAGPRRCSPRGTRERRAAEPRLVCRRRREGRVRSKENLGGPSSGSKEGGELVPAAVPAQPVLLTSLLALGLSAAPSALGACNSPHFVIPR